MLFFIGVFSMVNFMGLMRQVGRSETLLLNTLGILTIYLHPQLLFLWCCVYISIYLYVYPFSNDVGKRIYQ